VCAGLLELPVTSADQVMEMLRDADKRCKVSETKMNKMSNRAHRIFTIIAKVGSCYISAFFFPFFFFFSHSRLPAV
jgi:hypothetical protein